MLEIILLALLDNIDAQPVSQATTESEERMIEYLPPRVPEEKPQTEMKPVPQQDLPRNEVNDYVWTR